MAHKTNGILVTAMLRAHSAPDSTLFEMVCSAQRANNRLMQRLRRAGADDPGKADLEAMIRSLPPEEAAEMQSTRHEIPLHLLSSPAARRYATAIAEAAAACRAMEDERYGPNCDGFAECLEDYAEMARFELHGPAGLSGLED
jgi:hypothetical protein